MAKAVSWYITSRLAGARLGTGDGAALGDRLGHSAFRLRWGDICVAQLDPAEVAVAELRGANR